MQYVIRVIVCCNTVLKINLYCLVYLKDKQSKKQSQQKYVEKDKERR